MSANTQVAPDNDRERGRRVIAERAQHAPTRAGIYVFLGEGAELLYVGKASNLRRRLLNHAKSAAVDREFRPHQMAPAIREVRFVVCADERDALCREAELVMALRPRFNASIATDVVMFVNIARTPDGGTRFALSERTSVTGRDYGAFPHIGKGKTSWPSVRCNAGYSALLRLLWAAFAEGGTRHRVPSKLRGKSPATEATITIPSELSRPLHDFFTGRSRRLIEGLRASTRDVPDYMRRSFATDLDATELFFVLGPQALRALRLRHGKGTAPIDHATFATIVTSELREAIGDFVAPPAPPAETALVGARMSRSMHLKATRGRD